MAFNSYLTHEEYKQLGGTVSGDAFSILERKAQRLLDHITFNRIQHLTRIPDEVKEVLTEFINKMNDFDLQQIDGETIEEYSNGVETIKYRRSTNNQFNKELNTIAIQWLPEYLVNRSVNFDVEKYLQSESNDSE